MIILLFSILVINVFSWNKLHNGDLITTITIHEEDGIDHADFPVTFGHVFRRGSVFGAVGVFDQSSSSKKMFSQTDVKVKYPDGSIRHAVISTIIDSISADGNVTLELRVEDEATGATGMDKNAILTAVGVSTISLTDISNSGYSGTLLAELKPSIEADQFEYWLDGPVVTEIIVTQVLSNSLNAKWEVRIYPTVPTSRISHSIENVESGFMGNVDYAVDIQFAGRSIYSKTKFQHNYCARWRVVKWSSRHDEQSVEIRFNTAYIASTGHIWNYNFSLTVPEHVIEHHYNQYIGSDHDIMDGGTLVRQFPWAGWHAELGPLNQWETYYLFTMDNRMKEAMLGYATMSGSIPVHYRESDNTKSFYGKFLTIDDRPTISIGTGDGNTLKMWDSPNSADNLPPPLHSLTHVFQATGWTPENAHQPSFAYIAYMVTGDYYFLEELKYWAAFDLAVEQYGRGGVLGIYVAQQARAVAWALRQVAHTAVMIPIGMESEKEYFLEKLYNNFDHFYGKRNEYMSTTFGFFGDGGDSQWSCVDETKVQTGYTAWHVDYMRIVFNQIVELGLVIDSPRGANVTNTIDWLSWGLINRYSHPDWHPEQGSDYKLPTRYKRSYREDLSLPDGEIRGARVENFKEMYNHILPECKQTELGMLIACGYSQSALAALSSLKDLHLPRSQQAYDFVRNSIEGKIYYDSVWPHTGIEGYPSFAIIPRKFNPNFGSWKCDPECNAKADCISDNNCKCKAGFDGDGWKQCKKTKNKVIAGVVIGGITGGLAVLALLITLGVIIIATIVVLKKRKDKNESQFSELDQTE